MRIANATHLRGELFDQRPNRLIIPLGDFGDEIPDSTFGAVTDYVTEITDLAREELNAAAPESAVWWSAPALPYGPARVRQHDKAMLGLLPNMWFSVVAGLVDAGLSWCDRVVTVCSTEEQTHILRENIPFLREFGKEVAFCFMPYGEITAFRAEKLAGVLWENMADSSGELRVPETL